VRILVVEDDALVADAIRRGLDKAGFAADHVETAEHAVHAMVGEEFDLAVVDIGLPGLDGLALLQKVRRAGSALPILILTARDALADRVNALDLGADDYLVKPFALPELVARCRALIRRSRSSSSSEVRIGHVRIDLGARRAEVDGIGANLTRREWAVLECLVLNAGRVVAKERLLQAIANWDKDIGANAIEVYVSRLRTKLAGQVPIRTVRGLGYRLDDTPA
jgi:DNA-binding response OmpR family regulator